MAFDRIKVLLERLQQRFNAAEYDELRRELAAADGEIAALQAVRDRLAADDKAAELTRDLDNPFGSVVESP